MRRLIVLLVLTVWHASAQNVPMRAYDSARTGWNGKETTFTQQKIRNDGLRLIPQGPIPLEGDARGTEGAPLIQKGVVTPRGTRDLVVIGNLANNVQAFDAGTGEEIWRTNVGRPVDDSKGIDDHTINQHWGCLPTGAIWKMRVYESCWVSADGTPEKGKYFLFTLDLATGKQLNKVLVQDDNEVWKMRASLLVAAISGRDTIVVGHGSVYETRNGLTGGLTFYDIAQQKVTLQWKTSAGIWNAGEGVVLSSAGIVLMTGNGAFEPSKGWFGESMLTGTYKYDGAKPATFTVTSNFSPWTDYQRAGKPDPNLPGPATAAPTIAKPAIADAMPGMAPKLAGVNALSEEVRAVNGGMQMTALTNATTQSEISPDGQIVTRVYPDATMATGGNSDLDLGSGGVVYIAPLDQVCGGGKDGLLYCLPARNFGHTTITSIQNHHDNCKALIGGAPVYSTAYVGGVDPCTDNMGSLNFLPQGLTSHIHMTPVVFFDPVLKAWCLFVWGENFAGHKWKLNANAIPTYIAETNEYASVDVRGRTPGGMTGGMCSGASNGTDANSYILVCTVPYGDANLAVSAGRLLVYDPIHTDDTGHIRKLWDSADWGINFKFNKFLPPTIANGKIYYPAYDGRVLLLQ
jgi:outer membrane protein assembly factor BamB